MPLLIGPITVAFCCCFPSRLWWEPVGVIRDLPGALTHAGIQDLEGKALNYLEEQIPSSIPFLMPLMGNADHSPARLAAGQGLLWRGGSVGTQCPLCVIRGLDLMVLLILLQGASPLLTPPALSPCCSTSGKTEAAGS